MGIITRELTGTGHLVPQAGGHHSISIESVAGLDAVLSAAAAGPITGKILGFVLPTAYLSDCRAIRDAAHAGSYRGIPFGLADGGAVVNSKLCYKDAVFAASADVFAAQHTLSSNPFRGPPVPHPEGAVGASTPQEWEADVDGARPRRDLGKLYESTRAQLQAIGARLDSI